MFDKYVNLSRNQVVEAINANNLTYLNNHLNPVSDSSDGSLTVFNDALTKNLYVCVLLYAHWNFKSFEAKKIIQNLANSLGKEV